MSRKIERLKQRHRIAAHTIIGRLQTQLLSQTHPHHCCCNSILHVIHMKSAVDSELVQVAAELGSRYGDRAAILLVKSETAFQGFKQGKYQAAQLCSHRGNLATRGCCQALAYSVLCI